MNDGPRARIAVLITSHNRRSQTLTCLTSLLERQRDADGYELRVVHVDADSSDGTAAAIGKRFPEVERVPSNADTYWGGGMRYAGEIAGVRGLDFHLWLNDDVVLDEDALARLLKLAQLRPDSIIVGQLRSASGEATYGGLRRGPLPLRFIPVGIQSSAQPCDTFNGNVVLVPIRIVEQLGHIDQALPHAMGDIDYGLRARQLDIGVIQTPRSVGVCERNELEVWQNGTTPLVRIKRVASVKRLPPRAWWTLCRRHGGALALLYFVKPYLEVMRPVRGG